MYLQVYSRIQRLVRLRNLYLWHSHKTLHIIREMVQRLLNESTVAIVQIRLEAEGIKGGIEGFWLHWRSFCVNGSANHHLKERFLWMVTVSVWTAFSKEQQSSHKFSVWQNSNTISLASFETFKSQKIAERGNYANLFYLVHSQLKTFEQTIIDQIQGVI